ncbi:MAG: hypothetical protein HW388_1667 [Dehalococcoidia bacterium]|nr:hypothetical protein [Dehalococcoidia bacterium]
MLSLMSFRTQRSKVRNLGRPILAKGVGLRFLVAEFTLSKAEGLLGMTCRLC